MNTDLDGLAVQQPRPADAPQLSGRYLAASTGREPELSGLRARAAPPLIVHVDDDDGIRMLIRFVLVDHAGYALQSFESGREVLEFCHHTRPALLITDVCRPGIDGLTLCHLIRNDPDLFDLPLIILSAYGSHAIGQQAHALGAFLITKPCGLFELVDQIDRLVLEQGYVIPAHQLYQATGL
jgi:CheY-like chemotaxis protein